MNDSRELTLKSLPPEALRLVKTKTIHGKKRLSQWIVLLKTLSRFDEGTDHIYATMRSRATIAFILLFVASFISIFGVAFSGGHLAVVVIGSWVVFILLVTAIVYKIKASSLKKVDLENDFRDTLLPVLEALSEDIDPKAKISLNLNLDDPSQKKYKISEQKLPPGKNRKLIEQVFKIHTCNAVIPLENGAQLTLDIIKQPASYDRYYKTPRGKYKHKKKWKLITTVTTAIAPGKQKLQIDPKGVDRLASKEKIKIAEKKDGQRCKLTRRFKFKSATGIPGETVPPLEVIGMFMQMCSTLTIPE